MSKNHTPKQTAEQISRRLEKVLPLLHAGRLKEAVRQLEELTRSGEPHVKVLYNLGLALSDLGRMDEAILRLKRSLELDNRDVHTWVGLGTTYIRMGQPEKSHDAFTQALKLDPKNPYVLKSLGVYSLNLGRMDEAIEYLKAALDVMPSMDEAKFFLGLAYKTRNQPGDANIAQDILSDALKGNLSEAQEDAAKTHLTELASKTFKSIGSFRPDVLFYIMDTIRLFDQVGAETRGFITMQAALKGQSGLKINDSSVKYSLPALPGEELTGLHVLVLMYVGIRMMGGPYQKLDMDFDQEYTMAVQMWNKERNR